MGLTTSQNGINLIKQFEGCRLKAYKDSVGVLTIGYGHTKGVKAGQTITDQQAVSYLKSDLKVYEAKVNKYYPKYKFNQNQFDALVSFAFNIGSIDQLTARGTRSIATISSKILEYNKAGGKKLTGLVRRREAEKKLFDTPTTVKKSSTEIAKEVIAGKWGNGSTRKKKLTEAGYDYSSIQKEVNRLLKG